MAGQLCTRRSGGIARLQGEQRQALEVIERLGGKVYFSYQRDPIGKLNAFDPKAKPNDLTEFDPVIYVGLGESEVTNDDLKLLRKLPFIEGLDLSKRESPVQDWYTSRV